MSLQDKISSAKPTTFLTDGLSEEEVKQAVDEGRKRVSDTVKLIIEIPTETANAIKDNAMFAESIPSQIKWDVTSAIVNGIPLEDIIAEIADIPAFDYDTHKVRTRALEILDNITEREDTCE